MAFSQLFSLCDGRPFLLGEPPPLSSIRHDACVLDRVSSPSPPTLWTDTGYPAADLRSFPAKVFLPGFSLPLACLLCGREIVVSTDKKRGDYFFWSHCTSNRSRHQTWARAWSKSEIRSPTSSIPMERRTCPSKISEAARSSGLISKWLMDGEC